MYGYIYRTTLLDTGETYIGQHRKDKFDENYFGSGHKLKSFIKELKKSDGDNWKNHLKVEIIKWCDSQLDLDNKEIYWIDYERKHATLTPLNIADGGYIPLDQSAIAKEIWQREDYKEKISKIRKATANTPEFRKMLKDRNSNSVWINNGDNEKYIQKANLELFLEQGWVKGRLNKSVVNKVVVNKDGKTIFINKSELNSYIENGWIKGYTKTKRKGTIVVTNGIKNFYIKPEELQQYLSNGYKKGVSEHTKNAREVSYGNRTTNKTT